MSDDERWGSAEFLGEWTLAEMLAFMVRVDEIRFEEQAKAAAAEVPGE
jgi:hypothetical protein